MAAEQATVMPPEPPYRPLLFVAMPYGRRTEPGGSRVVDFDDLYARCIKPAAVDLGLESVRADEDAMSGIVHKPMYERLLLAEIVIADLTFANANVFYELGVRHAARPRSTILICAKAGSLPFDVQPLRVVFYELAKDGVAGGECERLQRRLAELLAVAQEAEGAPDSPPFDFFTGYPGVTLPRDVADSFRARTVHAGELSARIQAATKLARDEARPALNELDREVRALRPPEEQLLTELLLAHRNAGSWDAMVALVAAMPASLRAAPLIRQQLALALNRRDAPGDAVEAIRIIGELIDERGASPESLGILGRCYKQQWLGKRRDSGARALLDDAIDAYRRGFSASSAQASPEREPLLLAAVAGSVPRDVAKRRERTSMSTPLEAARTGARTRTPIAKRRRRSRRRSPEARQDCRCLGACGSFIQTHGRARGNRRSSRLGGRRDRRRRPRRRRSPPDRARRAGRVGGADPLPARAPRRRRHRGARRHGAGVGDPGVLGGAGRPRRGAARARRLALAAVLAARLPGRHRRPAPRAVRGPGGRDMYRELLAELARARGWEVHCYDAKHVEAQAAELLGERAEEVLRGPRAVLGPPWTRDHRVALAATVVAGDEAAGRRRLPDATSTG